MLAAHHVGLRVALRGPAGRARQARPRSSHAKPGTHHIDTLAQIAGLKAKQRAMRKRYVLKAHEALKAPACGFLKDYTVEGECITVEKTPTPSQARHLRKQAAQKAKRKK